MSNNPHTPFKKIFVEKEVLSEEYTQRILKRLEPTPVFQIDNINNYFSRFNKPYLEKRDNLNLFIGKNRGTLIKEAPPAYGESKDQHFYFVHAYNCIYECQYCYLQGYFNSPDIVLFTNHQDICQEITRMAQSLDGKSCAVFHAGEFSDSLAMNHITHEWEIYFNCFSKIQNAKLELRTKSTRVDNLLKLTPHDNIIISYSVSPQQDSLNFDVRTPSFRARLRAMEKLEKAGFKIALHFDPIIYDQNYFARLMDCVKEIKKSLVIDSIEYISLGVVRFSKDSYRHVQKNYPDSLLLHQGEFITADDGKVKYPRPLRNKILKEAKDILCQNGFHSDSIYFCME